MIRKVIREGRAKGVSDSDVLMYAKISAHSGLDIQFDKEATRINSEFGIGNSELGIDTSSTASGPPSPAGEGLIYADGFYEAAKNRIVVNPDGKRTAERLLIHELDHAIRKDINLEFEIRNLREWEAPMVRLRS